MNAIALNTKSVVIIGAGQAGGEAAQRLRQRGFRGGITLIGEESTPPYQRPPLSKKYLSGELTLEQVLLRPASLYTEENITLITGVKAMRVDRKHRLVYLEDGTEICFDALILATGARPRRLPFTDADREGVCMFRTAADVDAIRPLLAVGSRLAIVGAGFIGLEVAAVARQLGLDVTVIELADRPLARVTSPVVAEFFRNEHESRGVRFRFGAQASTIKGHSRITALGLADGSEIRADLLVIGIGVIPETQIAQECGLAVGNGIVTDEYCRTSDPNIYAIGDCASRPLAHYENRLCRLESVHNAVEGAKVVAATIVGKSQSLEPPWFWSDQFDLKLQIAGLFSGYDSIAVRGNIEERAFAVFYYRGNRMIAVDAVNKPAEFLGAKLLIQTGRTLAPSVISDTARTMKELVANAH
jgi:3-phenylpropionate/trans-cinnamate dioxygenase ferredoxin reductase component